MAFCNSHTVVFCRVLCLLCSLWWLGLSAQTTAAPLIIEESHFVISSPLLSANHQLLYYSYADHPRNQGNKKNADIWLRHRQADGGWAQMINVGSPINSVANDYPIGLSADGKRLAVLRLGFTNFLDILQQDKRSWHILVSLPLDADIAEASFDLESQRLVYSKIVDGQADLFQRQLSPNGLWSREEALAFVNSSFNERGPYLSYDGRSLYFQREGTWFVSYLQGEKAFFNEAKQLEQGSLEGWKKISISVTESETVLGISPNGHLAAHPLALADRPLKSKLLTGHLEVVQSPEDKLQGASIRLLVGGQEHQLYPDIDGNYTIVVPEDRYATIVAEAPGFFAASQTLNAQTTGQTTLAELNKTPTFSPEYYHREKQIKQLQNQVLASQATLAKLGRQRQALQNNIRQEQLAAGRELLDGFSDPELEALRARLQQAQTNLKDTLPPNSPPGNNKIKTKDIEKKGPITSDDLELMKAAFRAQQEEKLRQKGEDSFQWKDRNPLRLRRDVENVVQNSLIPELAEDLSRAALRQDTNKMDSLGMALEISSALFPSKTPAVYERQAWENELIDGLRPKTEEKLRHRLAKPIQENLRAEQQILSTYQQEQYRLEAYQDSLQTIYAQQWAEENQTLGQQRDFSTKGIAQQSSFAAPVEESQLSLLPLQSGQTIVLPQIQFLPNNNRFAPTAYQELDRLVHLLQTQEAMQIAITAHTNDQLGYLAAQELSEERAFAVLQYLTNKGIALQRLSYSGSGRQVPLVPNDSAENRAKNQRIEITIR